MTLVGMLIYTTSWPGGCEFSFAVGMYINKEAHREFHRFVALSRASRSLSAIENV